MNTFTEALEEYLKARSFLSKLSALGNASDFDFWNIRLATAREAMNNMVSNKTPSETERDAAR